ncbi:MAG: S9 family peptidase [Gemmatimonadota bacterium]|jgi:dipeptidyl aminopeptidase/acylaminoacyl peptidase
MQPTDLERLVVPSDPTVDPTGNRAVFVRTTMDLEEDRYVRSLWIADAGGVRPLTRGSGDTAPRFSPDGTQIVFLRRGEPKEAKPQVAVISVDGGEAHVLTDFPLGAEQAEWAPDGNRLVAVGVRWRDEWDDLEDEERSRRPRRITAHPYRFDNKGWTHDRVRSLYVLAADGSDTPRRVTDGDFDEGLPCWSPDGKRIAFVSDRDPRLGIVPGIDAWEVDVEAGELESALPRGSWQLLSYRPDGALHAMGIVPPDRITNWRVYRREPTGSLTDLTGELDRSTMSLAGGPPSLQWAGQTLYTGYEDSGTLGVLRVEPDGASEVVLGGTRVVSGFAPSPDRIHFTATTTDAPADLFVAEGGKERRLTHFGDVDFPVSGGEHFTVESDGWELDVWSFLPEGGERVPLLLNIHGGPAAQYGHAFFDEFQVYVGAGYGVVACNPRGSAGKGDEFVRAVAGDGWGRVDRSDIDVVVREALRRYPRLDPDRMGVMGGSYGGFLSAWLIGQEDRWRSAVVERALLVWDSFAGTSDIGATFPAEYTGADHPDGWDTWWEKSPLRLADRVRTPTLLLHAENDYRCPIEQAEQYFMALLKQGVEVEMLRFPGEGHELSRNGAPKHRVERFEAILDWHARHLQ